MWGFDFSTLQPTEPSMSGGGKETPAHFFRFSPIYEETGLNKGEVAACLHQWTRYHNGWHQAVCLLAAFHSSYAARRMLWRLVSNLGYRWLASRGYTGLGGRQAHNMSIVLTAPPFASAPPVSLSDLDHQRFSMPIAIQTGIAYVAHIDTQTSAVIIAQDEELRKRRWTKA